MEKKSIYNMKKVHTVNIVILTILEFFLSFLSLKGCDSKTGLMCFIAAAIFTALSIGLLFIKIKEEVKALFFSLIPTIVAVCLILTEKVTPVCCHYMFFLSIAMIALYFKRELIIIYQITINILYLSLFAVKGFRFIDSSNSFVNIWSGIQVIVCINFILILLFFLTKWGKQLIESAEEKERIANELAAKLNISIDELKKHSEILNTNISAVNKNIDASKDSISSVTAAIADISDGITDQSDSLKTINGKMNISSENIKKSQDISEKVTSHSESMNAELEEGYKKINDMDKQMEIIYQSVSTSRTTVSELQDSIEEINKFLQVITEIAEQTNMLALNAAIEAARAGEHGKGFAVVADEVRSLAESSSNTVSDINNIINIINQKTTTAVDKVQLGEDAVKSGQNLIANVKKTFDVVKEESYENSNYLASSTHMNNETNNEFMQILESIKNIADISQNQAAAIEEISATMETTTEDITNISNSVCELNILSSKINTLTK